jgi:hypothetical protein
MYDLLVIKAGLNLLGMTVALIGDYWSRMLRGLHFSKLFLQIISVAESKLCDSQWNPQKQLFN